MSNRHPIYEDPRGRRATADTVALRRWINDRFTADPEPLPARFRFYEAVMAGAVDKHDAAGFTRALTWLRERGRVADSWTPDPTRELIDRTGYDSVLDPFRDLSWVKLDPWDGWPPIVLVESQASMVALRPVLAEYRCVGAALRGQASRGFIWNDIAPHVAGDNHPVLLVVDFDKAGEDIGRSAVQRIEDASGVRLDVDHVALTEAQVDSFGLPLVWRDDERFDAGHPERRREVAETEALGAGRLRGIVADALADLLPEPLADIHDREREQRRVVAAALDGVGL